MKTSSFQIGIIVAFIVFLVVAVLIFSGVIKVGGNSTTASIGGTIVIWGTAPGASINSALDAFNKTNKPLTVVYSQKNPSTYAEELVEGFASGFGPDIFMLSNDMITQFANKIAVTPFVSFPARNFQDSFISAGDIFLSSEGVLAMPVAVDPLVLYYNIDSFNSAGIGTVPLTWDDFKFNSVLLTKKDEASVFKGSGAALGTYDNVSNAKDILYAMLIQSGNYIVKKNPEGRLIPDFNIGNKTTVPLKYYVQFSNPSSDAYSWNSSFDRSINMFTSSSLAQYIGFGSELSKIQSSNPNLNFDIARLPQMQSGMSITYGKLYGLAISKTTRNMPGANKALIGIATSDFSKVFAGSLGMPSAKKSLLSSEPKNSFDPILNSSAFISRSVIEPGSDNMNKIFRTAINGVNSGAISDINSYVQTMLGQLGVLLTDKKI